MADYKASHCVIFVFVLNEVFEADKLCRAARPLDRPPLNAETADAMLKRSRQDYLAEPLRAERSGDERRRPSGIYGVVTNARRFQTGLQHLCRGGWVGPGWQP